MFIHTSYRWQSILPPFAKVNKVSFRYDVRCFSPLLDPLLQRPSPLIRPFFRATLSMKSDLDLQIIMNHICNYALGANSFSKNTKFCIRYLFAIWFELNWICKQMLGCNNIGWVPFIESVCFLCIRIQFYILSPFFRCPE